MGKTIRFHASTGINWLNNLGLAVSIAKKKFLTFPVYKRVLIYTLTEPLNPVRSDRASLKAIGQPYSSGMNK